MEQEFFSKVVQKTDAENDRKSESRSRSRSISRSPSVQREQPNEPKDSRSPSRSNSPPPRRSPSDSRHSSNRRSPSDRPDRSRSRSGRRHRSSMRYGTDPTHCSLIVRGFRGHVERAELDHVFSAYGRVVDVHIPRDYYTHEQRGFAFIEYENRDQAEDAISHLDNQDVCGSVVSVSIAKNNRKSSDEMRRIYGHRRSRSRSRDGYRRYDRRSYMRRSRSSSYDRHYYREGSYRRYDRRSYSRRD